MRAINVLEELLEHKALSSLLGDVCPCQALLPRLTNSQHVGLGHAARGLPVDGGPVLDLAVEYGSCIQTSPQFVWLG